MPIRIEFVQMDVTAAPLTGFKSISIMLEETSDSSQSIRVEFEADLPKFEKTIFLAKDCPLVSVDRHAQNSMSTLKC
jgi:hypothetical protein